MEMSVDSLPFPGLDFESGSNFFLLPEGIFGVIDYRIADLDSFNDDS